MQDLRLVGVHDDGKHLLLSGAGGEMFQLPIDEALRVAASRTPAKAVAAATAAPIAMSPRDIQARIRNGSTAAEVAELSGIPLAKVQRYEGPGLAEREYIAQQARKVEDASPGPGQDVYRSAFGDSPATLNDMVAHRLTAHGIDASSVEWDSWRRTDGNWNVVARFDQQSGHAGIGEEPPAMWTFNPSRKSLQNANRWAQQLSELEPLDGPVPARRLSAVSDRPFDFETDADATARTATAQQNVIQQLQPQQNQEADGLLDMLRSRRGQRLGLDEDADDALARLLTNGVPAAHPRPSELPSDAPAEAAGDEPGEPAEELPAGPATDGTEADGTESEGTEAGAPNTDAPDAQAEADEQPGAGAWGRRGGGRPSIMSRLALAPAPDGPEDEALKLHDGVSTDTREITIVASQLRPTGQQEPTPSKGLDELLGGGNPRRQQRDAAGSRTDRESEQPERQPAKPKRSSVPSWDDIVFGTRGD
jgi:hypothetical protein